MYYVYMLKSKGIKSVTYVGYTKDIKKRVLLHNKGKGAKYDLEILKNIKRSKSKGY